MSLSIDDDLCRLAGVATIEKAAIKIGLLPETIRLKEFTVIKDWYRAGSETYISRCLIVGSDGFEKEFLVKACIAIPYGRSADAVLDKWISRRRRLSNQGISTPHLYAYGYGILVEEFIPLTLAEACSSTTKPQVILEEAIRTARIIADEGYHPVTLFPDLRSRKADVVVVDFGADLGDVDSSLPIWNPDSSLTKFLAGIASLDISSLVDPLGKNNIHSKT